MPKASIEDVVVAKGEKMGGDEEADAVDFYASAARKGTTRATEVYKSNKVYDGDDEDDAEEAKEADYAKMTNEQKLELVTSNNGQVNLAKLRQLEKKSGIVPLERVDHSAIRHRPFTKNFYAEHPFVEGLTSDHVNQIRKEKQIFVKGELVSKPVIKFEHLLDKVVDSRILAKLASQQGIVEPTPIQSQAIPCALQGRDVLGIAQTGSGKTYAYLVPLVTHVLEQPELMRAEGPIALVLAPTRELCQ